MKDMVVKDAMTHLVVTLRPDDPLHLAAAQLARHGISGAPVVTDGKVVGILTESDVIRFMTAPASVEKGMSPLDGAAILLRPHKEGPRTIYTSDAMSTSVLSVTPETSIWRVASLMESRGIKRLPVNDEDGYLVGIISRADLVRVMGRPDEAIRDDIVDAIKVLGEDTLGDLAVDVSEGIVTLEGTVDRKTTGRIAVEIATRIPGAIEVVDRLRFEWDDTKRPPATGNRTSLQDHLENRDWVPAGGVAD